MREVSRGIAPTANVNVAVLAMTLNLNYEIYFVNGVTDLCIYIYNNAKFILLQLLNYRYI